MGLLLLLLLLLLVVLLMPLLSVLLLPTTIDNLTMEKNKDPKQRDEKTHAENPNAVQWKTLLGKPQDPTAARSKTSQKHVRSTKKNGCVGKHVKNILHKSTETIAPAHVFQNRATPSCP